MPDLAAQQAALVRALVAGGPPPSGFDTRRLALARKALLDKRARGVAAHRPALGALPDFGARFATWADGRPSRGTSGDAAAFAQSLGADLTAAVRVEAVLVGDRRWARDVDGVVVRLPGLGVRRWTRHRRTSGTLGT
jgi:hypothetical protein